VVCVRGNVSLSKLSLQGIRRIIRSQTGYLMLSVKLNAVVTRQLLRQLCDACGLIYRRSVFQSILRRIRFGFRDVA